ncbi:MAG: bacillithiol biosynthesis cysteine-adding enzyme BshC [Acidobacteria bacterium]|nr:bacillithiol biosynthesis cysteine-adding enzyme BshC [Acidobacteriota bacterium]
MQAQCKRQTEIPHTSRLYNDLLYHYDRVAAFYPHAPFSFDSFRAAAHAVDYPAERRQQLVTALRVQNGGHPALDSLARPRTLAVVTGQQVGLFSGPAYTIYKALTAVRLARKLSEEGIEAVPVFWLATEDHDLAEVSSCWSFTPSHDPILLQLEARPGAQRPVGGIPLESVPLEQLRQSLKGFAFGDEIEAMVGRCYQPGRTLGDAFASLLRELLEPYGLLFIDPMHPASRKLAAPILRSAIEAAPDLIEQLLDRNQKLAGSGYHAQVHIERHTSLFFLLENGRRVSLRRKNGDYFTRDRRLTPAELEERAFSLSPNATLRPVVQDYMLPTVAYIGGPAELAYLAQSEVLYRALLGRMPVALPRNGFTLVDDRGRKLMHRYGLHLDSFFGGQDALRELIAARLTPPELAACFAEVEAETKRNLATLGSTVAAFDATLAQALDRSAGKIQYQLGKMQRKVARESLRRSERAQQESAYLFNLLYPRKHLQERFYTILPFLARHGTDLIERIYDNVHAGCPDHHLLFV